MGPGVNIDSQREVRKEAIMIRCFLDTQGVGVSLRLRVPRDCKSMRAIWCDSGCGVVLKSAVQDR